MSGQGSPLGNLSYNPYAVGRKQYGQGATFAPTMGQVDPTGYVDRDARVKAQRNALLAWMKDRNQGNYASPNAQRMGM